MIPQNKNLKELARKLRNNATRQENHLWYDFLRTYPVQFSRQTVILNYIADFYCAKARLIIELDGSQHYTEEGICRDNERKELLQTLGLEVLRFSNLDIDRNFTGVCESIAQAVRERTKQSVRQAQITRPCGATLFTKEG